MSATRATAAPGGGAAQAATTLGAALHAARQQALAGTLRALPLQAMAFLATVALALVMVAVFMLVRPTQSVPNLVGLAIGGALVVTVAAACGGLRGRFLGLLGDRAAAILYGPAAQAMLRGNADPRNAAAQCIRDVEAVRGFVGGLAAEALLDALMVPLILLVLWMTDWRFAALGGLLVILCAASSAAAARLAQRALRALNEHQARTAAAVADAMGAAETVQAMGMAPALLGRWLARAAEMAAPLRSTMNSIHALSTLSFVLGRVSTGGFLLLGMILAVSGELAGYGILFAMLLSGRLLSPFQRLGDTLLDVAEARGAWERLHAVRGARRDEPSLAFPCPEGRLVVERLTVFHPGSGRPLISNINMVVSPGEVVGIAGSSGSGKTLLLRHLIGMHRPATGAALLDGHATWLWDREDLARHVGYAPQEGALSDATVASVIARLETPDITEVFAVARRVGLHDRIVRLPHGYATVLGPACRLSGGERQRMLIARALYGRPKLLVLDEPGSALDAEGEAVLFRLFREVRAEGCALIFTSHSMRLLRAADRILTIRGGQLRSSGPRPLALPRPEAA